MTRFIRETELERTERPIAKLVAPACPRFLAAMVLVLTHSLACGSTGIAATGPNQYLVSETDIGDTWSDGGKVLAKLYREAQEHCGEQGLMAEGIEEKSAPGRTFVRNASATLRFRCVPKPERPSLE